MLRLRYRLGLGAVVMLVLVGSLLLMGNESAAIDQRVKLSALEQTELTQDTFVQNRKALFGSDPLSAGAALEASLRFTRKATKEAINGEVVANGSLQTESSSFPIAFSGEAQVIQTEDGKEFYTAVATGSIRVRGQNVPVTAFVSGVPNNQQYLVTVAVQPVGEKVAVFAFGAPFPAYSSWVEMKNKVIQGQVKEGK